ncbi:MAG: hypothetical protein AB7O39_03315 [Flavobacteriaceae bacterium]
MNGAVKKQEVAIRISSFGADVVRTTEAFTYGSFAAHQNLNDPDEWTVTHIPTGLGLYSSLGVFPDSETAIKAMIRLEDAFPDWATWLPRNRKQGAKLKKMVIAIGESLGSERYEGTPPQGKVEHLKSVTQ